MFDELDDPAFAGAGTGAREAVAARAATIRRRRRAAWAGGGTSLALVLATIVYATGTGSPRSLDVVDEMPSPSASATSAEPGWTAYPTESASPASSPSPAEGVSRSAGPVVTASADPEPTETEGFDFGWDKPDGEPGWSSGYGGCSQSTALPEPGTAPFPEVTLELRVPEGPIRGGESYTAHALLTNTGDRYLRFALEGYEGAVLADGRGNRNGRPWSDAIPVFRIELAPGATVEHPVHMTTYVCGDTSGDPNTPLPAGTYTVSAPLRWSDRTVGTTPSPDPEPSETGGPILPTQQPSEEPTPEPSPSPSWGEPEGSKSGMWATPRISVAVG